MPRHYAGRLLTNFSFSVGRLWAVTTSGNYIVFWCPKRGEWVWSSESNGPFI